MANLTFFSSQFTEWLDNEYFDYFEAAWIHLRDSCDDVEELWDTVEWAATQRMTKQASVELAHHNEKIKKMCGFGNCKYIPSCIKDLI